MLNWATVQELVDGGYIATQHDPATGYTLYNYTSRAQYESLWTPETIACRGLIVDADYHIIALPFPKFFNWFEGGRRSRAPMLEVTEKLDGSLGILYRVRDARAGGAYRITTRGSMVSEQSQWATAHLNAHYDLRALPDELTLLFEIVYPENRVVVDYGERESLVLVGARNRFDPADDRWYFDRDGLPGLYSIAQAFGFELPQFYNFNDVTAILEAAGELDASAEGWVMRFADGQRFKIKGDRYTELHRLITGLSYKRVLGAVQQGRYEDLLRELPEEFRPTVEAWHADIQAQVEAFLAQIEAAFAAAPQTSRKDFAHYANKHHRDLAGYLFAMLDGKDVRQLVLERAIDVPEEEI